MTRRAVKQKRPIMDDEERQKKLHQLFYLAEAFLENGDSALSMNTLIPKLLGAKSTEEITEIYKEHNVDHQALGKGVYLLDIAVRDYYMEQKDFDDPTPLYAKWLYYAARKASALCELYTVCLRVIRKESQKDKVFNVMDILCAANKAFEHMVDEVRNKEYTLREVYDIFPSAYPDYCNIPNFPLMFLFRKFEENHGETLREKYVCPYHQTSIQEHYQFRYWEEFKSDEENKVKKWKRILENPCGSPQRKAEIIKRLVIPPNPGTAKNELSMYILRITRSASSI